MRFALIVPALALAAACASPCPPAVTGMTQVRFECADGSDIVVNFSRSPETAQILQEGYAPVTLPARNVGSGYRYVDAGAELRGRSTQASWTRPGAAQTLCSETAVTPDARATSGQSSGQ